MYRQPMDQMRVCGSDVVRMARGWRFGRRAAVRIGARVDRRPSPVRLSTPCTEDLAPVHLRAAPSRCLFAGYWCIVTLGI